MTEYDLSLLCRTYVKLNIIIGEARPADFLFIKKTLDKYPNGVYNKNTPLGYIEIPIKIQR